MGYRAAIEAAGAEVLDELSTGSYQGTYLFYVNYNGQKGVVEAWYGSCTFCDSYQAEFGWDDPSPERLAAFGQGYLDDIQEPEALLKKYGEQAEWDMEAGEIVSFLKRLTENV